MKARYKNKCFVTIDDIEREVKRECDAKIDAVYEEVKNDVASQIMAVCCMELNKEFDFGKVRLNRFYEGVNNLFKCMITDENFTPINCIDWLRDKYGIDLDEKAP